MAAPVLKAPKAPKQPLPSDVIDVVESGDLPGVPARQIPPTHGQQGRIKASLSQEYVTAGQYQFYLNYLRSQPYDFDDLTRDVGIDVYDKMQHDSQIAKLVNDFKAGMLADEVSFASSITDEDDPDHEAAVDLANWVTWVMERLDTPLTDVMWDMGNAVAEGSRLAELVYEVGPDRDGVLALLLKKIKVKPRNSIAYVTDSFNNLVGVLGMVPGQPFMPQQGLIITDPTFISNFLPRDKFCLYSFRPENSDPRGTSVLRAAYDPWWVKQQVKRSFVKYLDRFGSPSLIGYTPEGAEIETTVDEDGTVTVSGKSPEQFMADSLAEFQNATAMAFPFGSKVEKVEAQGNGEAFIKAFQFTNNEMAGAILGQTLSTEQSTHQTQGAGKVHQDTKDTIMKNARKGMARMLSHDVIEPLVKYNRGEDALRMLPKVLIGGVEQHIFEEMAAGIAALATAGYLGPSQYPGIDQMLGLPTRDEDADAATAQEAMAAQADATASAHAEQAKLLGAATPQTPQEPATGAPGKEGPLTKNGPASGKPAATEGSTSESARGKAPAGSAGGKKPAKASSFAFFASPSTKTRKPKKVTVETGPSDADIAHVSAAYSEWAKTELGALWP